MRFKLGLAAAAVAVVGLGVTVASADNGTFTTQVTIHKGGERGTFHGNVLSERSGCYDHRRVHLFDEDEDPAQKVAHTFTDSDGHWKINAQNAWLPSGDYYAEVRKKDIQHKPGQFRLQAQRLGAPASRPPAFA